MLKEREIITATRDSSPFKGEVRKGMGYLSEYCGAEWRPIYEKK